MSTELRKASPRVAVRLMDGTTVTGRMRKRTSDTVNLIDGKIAGGGAPVPLDGELQIERRQVLWVQRPD